MGMPVTIDVRGGEPALLDAAYAELRRIDDAYSPFKHDSIVTAIARGRLREDDAPDEVREIIALCRRYTVLTEGSFDAWVSGRFEPSGLVKGWAIARVAGMLDAAGARDYFVDAGGDVRTRGERAPGLPWRVGIRHPIERDRVAVVVDARDLAVATSGTYEKGAHILDPFTGAPASALLSVTVTGPDIVTADVFATAAFAMGLRGLDFIERQDGYEAYAIAPPSQAGGDLLAYATSRFPAARY